MPPTQQNRLEQLLINGDFPALSATLRRRRTASVATAVSMVASAAAETLPLELFELEIAIDNYFAASDHEKPLSVEQLAEPDLLHRPLPFAWRPAKIDSVQAASVLLDVDRLDSGIAVTNVTERHSLAARLEFIRQNYLGALKVCQKVSSGSNQKSSSQFSGDLSRSQAIYIKCVEFLAKTRIRDICDEDFQWLWTNLIDITANSELITPVVLGAFRGWGYWLEETLYRISAHLFQQLDWQRSLLSCRAYLLFCRSIPLDRCQLKRLSICHMLLHGLLQCFRSSNYRPPVVPLACTQIQQKQEQQQQQQQQKSINSIKVPQSLEQELSELISLMEHIAIESVTYPHAGQPNGVIETVYDDITLVYSLFNHTPPTFLPSSSTAKQRLQEEAVKNKSGDSDEDDKRDSSLPQTNRSSWSRFIESCYRATGLTFRSRKQLRRLGLAAVLVEAADEAIYAFKAYLERDKKDQLGDWFRRAGISENLDLFRKDRGRPGDNETVEDVMAVLVAATRVYMSVYNPHQAISMAEQALELCKIAARPNSCCRSLEPMALYYFGEIYAKLGIESLEHDLFATLQETGYSMMQAALLADPNNYKFHYGLALQAAEMGYMDQAVDHVKSALKLNCLHIPSWHLLALLATACKKPHNTELAMVSKAIQICHAAGAAVLNGRQVPAKLYQDRRKMKRHQLITCPVQYREQWLNFQLTLALLEEMHGQSSGLMNNCLIEKGTPIGDDSRSNKDNFLLFGGGNGVDLIYHSNSQQPRKTEDFLLDNYRVLFELYSAVYFPNLVQRLDRSNTRSTVGSAFNGNSDSSGALSGIMFLKSLPQIMEELSSQQSSPHPPVSTFYPTTSPHLEIPGFAFMNAAYPISAQTQKPLHSALFLQRRKQRYMELWLQIAQVFRRAGKLHDARMACIEAQNIQRGNADVEYELGMISLMMHNTMQESGQSPSTNLSSGRQPQQRPIEEIFQIDPESSADQPASILPLINGGVDPTDFHAYSGIDAGAPALSPPATNVNTSFASSIAGKPQQSENLDSAQSHFLSALTYDEDHTPARTWLGRCYYLQGNFEMARAELERACRGGRVRGAKVWNAWHQLAMVYQVLGESNRAVECFGAALERETVSVPLMSLRGLEVLPRML